MYNYEKRLQYPINIKIRSPKIAQIVISQYGGAYINNVGHLYKEEIALKIV